MIFTSYIGKLNKIPTGRKICIIMRYLPKDLEPLVANGKVEWLPELSPTPYALNLFHETGDFTIIEDSIRDSWENDITVKSAYDRLYMQGSTEDIFLLCCESDHLNCHRSVVGELFSNKYNMPYSEWQASKGGFWNAIKKRF